MVTYSTGGMVPYLVVLCFGRLCVALSYETPADTPYALFLKTYADVLNVWLEPKDVPPDVDDYEVC